MLPDVGEGLIEAEIVGWKVKVGDVVTLNQPLVDIETAKATVELPSPYAGTVVSLHGDVGDVIAVHQPLITFNVEGEASTAMTQASGEGREAVLVGYGVAAQESVTSRTHRRRTTSSSGPTNEERVVPVATARSFAPRSTPPVRLYAKQHGVDLSSVPGTGRDGLITRDDVDRALSAPSLPRAGAPLTGPTSSSRFVGRDIQSWSSGPKEERIPVKGVLRTMSDAMTASAFSAPHAAVWVRVDATRAMELLSSLKQRTTMAGIRLTPLTLVALAFCDAARHFPGINSSFDVAASEVVVRRSVNLGIAANTDRGLIVPNIKGADELDLVGMATALNGLIDKARAGTTTPGDMLGTTLTITNVGMFGVDGAVPILPPGTGAILAVGQIAKTPWVVEDRVAIRQAVELSMSFDHRQIDGALASAVLSHVGHFLEDPAAALLAG